MTPAVVVDDEIVHSGRWSTRFDRKVDSPNGFSTLTLAIPVDFSGSKVELLGFLRTENVSEFAGLWMREDGDSGRVGFDIMQQRQLKGTTGWEEYSVTLPLQKDRTAKNSPRYRRPPVQHPPHDAWIRRYSGCHIAS